MFGRYNIGLKGTFLFSEIVCFSFQMKNINEWSFISLMVSNLTIEIENWSAIPIVPYIIKHEMGKS